MAIMKRAPTTRTAKKLPGETGKDDEDPSPTSTAAERLLGKGGSGVLRADHGTWGGKGGERGGGKGGGRRARHHHAYEQSCW